MGNVVCILCMPSGTVEPVLYGLCHERPLVLNDRFHRHGLFLIDVCTTCYKRPPVLETAFAGKKRWSPKTGSTVVGKMKKENKPFEEMCPFVSLERDNAQMCDSEIHLVGLLVLKHGANSQTERTDGQSDRSMDGQMDGSFYCAKVLRNRSSVVCQNNMIR